MRRLNQVRKTFRLERGDLVRYVEQRNGPPYTHRCSLRSLTEVVRFIEEQGEVGVTSGMIWESLEDVSCTQAAVALDFLKERGCVVKKGRRNFAGSRFLYEDAMCEFHALAYSGD